MRIRFVRFKSREYLQLLLEQFSKELAYVLRPGMPEADLDVPDLAFGAGARGRQGQGLDHQVTRTD